ncbi:MAG: T9SS type A sorting domain-containing protein [Flavitalea sp.]
MKLTLGKSVGIKTITQQLQLQLQGDGYQNGVLCRSLNIIRMISLILVVKDSLHLRKLPVQTQTYVPAIETSLFKNIAGASYSWTFSSTLSAVGATNTNQVTVQRNGNSHGAAWVQVQISTACSATPVTTKVDFTAGFPQVTTPISGTNFAVQGGQYYFTQEVPLNYPAVAYNWQVSSGWQVLNNQQQQTAFIQAGSTGGFIDVSMTACGITRLNSKYVEIGGGGGDPARGTTGQDFDFTFSPNPASTTVNIIATGITTDYDVMIFDLMTSKIVKQQKVNKSQKQLTMQIGKLRSGLYVIQITSDGKSRSKQLSVSK